MKPEKEVAARLEVTTVASERDVIADLSELELRSSAAAKAKSPSTSPSNRRRLHYGKHPS